MSSNPIHQIWTTSKIQRLPAELRRKVDFYAPLVHSLDYLGIGEATFTRALAAAAVYRDGASHVVSANFPRFEYSAGAPIGLPISSEETLSFPIGNRLESGTLIWFEENVVKVAPLTSPNPFRAGAWRGPLDTHFKDIVHVEGPLTDGEIDQIIRTIADQAQAPFVTNDWLLEEPAKITATTRLLARAPDLSTLLLSVGGVLLKRVASSPTITQYSINGQTITFGGTFTGTPAVRALYRRSGLSGAGFVIEDLAGTKDGANTAFTVSQAPTDGVILVVRGGTALEKVGSSAGLMQYEISGANVTLGTAPESGDDLWALLMTSGSGFSVENLTGTKDGANKDFTISAGVIENTAVIFHQGIGLTRVGNTPALLEHTLSSTNVAVGFPPASTHALWAFLRTS